MGLYLCQLDLISISAERTIIIFKNKINSEVIFSSSEIISITWNISNNKKALFSNSVHVFHQHFQVYTNPFQGINVGYSVYWFLFLVSFFLFFLLFLLYYIDRLQVISDAIKFDNIKRKLIARKKNNENMSIARNWQKLESTP